MQVRLQPPNARDELFLIRVEAFMRLVDSADLAQRNSQSIEDAYHRHWLSLCSDGTYLFHAPAFYLTNGKASFINGRHRTLLLARHLAEIPMALTNMDGYPIYASQPQQKSVEALDNISVRRAIQQEIFVFPDLPIRYLGYDPNISK